MATTLTTIEERIPIYYNTSVLIDGPSFHFESPPGRGKSMVLRNFPQIMKRFGNLGIVIIQGESETLGGLSGYQQLLNATTKDHLLRSVFSNPHWWFDRYGKALEEFDGGLIFVDEYDKMEKENKMLVAAMRLEKRIANHFLPDGWVVWTAGNRKQDLSGYTKDLGFNVNRVIVKEILDDIDSLLKWMEEHEVLPEIMSFAKENSKLVFMDMPKILAPWCSPRSLTQADMHLRSIMKVTGLHTIPTDLETQDDVQGGIGKVASDALFLHIKMGTELPEYIEVVSHPETVVIPDDPGRKRLFIYKIAERSVPQHAGQILTWVQRFPNEFQVMFARMVGLRRPIVIAQPAFREWSRQNAALMAVVTQYAKNNAQAA